MQSAIEHRPVYGSSEKDEFICSCGWSGATAELPAHYEAAAESAWQAVQEFVTLLQEKGAGASWSDVRELEDEPAYLSPEQFVWAMRSQALKHHEQ